MLDVIVARIVFEELPVLDRNVLVDCWGDSRRGERPPYSDLLVEFLSDKIVHRIHGAIVF